MTLLKYILSIIFSLCLVLLIILVAVQLPMFNLGFYSGEYDKYGIPESIGVSKEDLLAVTRHMVDYMRGKEENLQINVAVWGAERGFFNERELLHMDDVKLLVLGGLGLRNRALALLLAAGAALALLARKERGAYLVCCRVARLTSLIVTAAAAVLIFLFAWNFNAGFTMFHKIFFSNDLWILDPRTDLLIQIVPLPFFIDISIAIAAIYIIGVACVILASCLYIAKKRVHKPV
ncbi:MAG: TIGR01906 family membrane protein [Clostridiales bacterium]|jgi:integral membrane protein (TIGR01906 family)|nr:TIGR01906 family membrane protein [Clostridiales bacterium]